MLISFVFLWATTQSTACPCPSSPGDERFQKSRPSLRLLGPGGENLWGKQEAGGRRPFITMLDRTLWVSSGAQRFQIELVLAGSFPEVWGASEPRGPAGLVYGLEPGGDGSLRAAFIYRVVRGAPPR